MTSMTTATVRVIGGVDTHGQSHHAAVIDGVGRQLDDREFPASPAGYGALLEWLRGYGELDRVGVEGTGTYGVALTRHLREAGALVVEVDRPDRRARRAQGKSDPLDAYSAARAALSGAASVVPKLRDGRVEAIRALRVARSSAVKARSQATNQIKALIVTGPAQLREQLPPAHWDGHCGLRTTAPWPQSRRCRTGHQDRAAPARTSPPAAIRGNRRG
jgi:transposase